MMKREVKKKWYVNYNEMDFPAVQKGMILEPGHWQEFDPFLLMAEDWFKRGTFSDHPHRGFQTLTYVIDGRLEHIDNRGGHGILESGDVQYMNAGAGARHAEEAVDDDIAHTLQLWINLPKDKKDMVPSYQDIRKDATELVSFDGAEVRVYAGNAAGVEGPLQSAVPMTLAEITLEPGASYTHVIPANHNAFLYVLSGDMDFGEQKENLKKTGTATLTYDDSAKEENESELSIHANSRSRVLVYSGEPIREEVAAHGPFVMNTMGEVKKAFLDFQTGKFGPQVRS
ncbi:pirin family protein [Halobacillus sp. BBL2006]|uniref:pirin family protein n=1 Tax=Halobacillus sp. BBL2006 TaxID=1543706 RepID=UPI000541CDC9|nr:pirin family protein [Halobacillus sp. BBL2006]KHE67230.1 pirin [Halobacillus sp. BBL2006]